MQWIEFLMFSPKMIDENEYHELLNQIQYSRYSNAPNSIVSNVHGNNNRFI